MTIRNSHYTLARTTECYSCGETKICMVRAADYPESETGYVDELALCGECAAESGLIND